MERDGLGWVGWGGGGGCAGVLAVKGGEIV